MLRLLTSRAHPLHDGMENWSLESSRKKESHFLGFTTSDQLNAILMPSEALLQIPKPSPGHFFGHKMFFYGMQKTFWD